jgi:predicted transcriptional regulator
MYKKYQVEEHNVDKLKILGNVLRQYREINSFSRGYIDNEYSISKSLIERAEKGANITLVTLFRLYDIYDIPLYELMNEVEYEDF